MATFKKGSVGRRLFVYAGIDLTTVTALQLLIKKSDASTLTIAAVDITIGTVDITTVPAPCVDDPDETWLAGEYCYITWGAGDLDVAGIYQGELSGSLPSGQEYGNIFRFSVAETLS